MSEADFFAGCALAPFLAQRAPPHPIKDAGWIRNCCESAYAVSDAMMAERAKRGG